MLNDWKPFTVIPAGEFKNNSGETEQWYRVVLQVPGFQTWEQFEGNLQECHEECLELNVRIGASLSQHIMDKNKKPSRATLEPWESLYGRKES